MNLVRRLLWDDVWLRTRRLLLLGIWIALAVMTHVPVPQSVQQIRVSDKLIHLLAYFPLGLLLPTCAFPALKRFTACFLVIAAYGVLDELLQIPVGRTASVWDWFADLAGAMAGCGVCQLILKTKALGPGRAAERD